MTVAHCSDSVALLHPARSHFVVAVVANFVTVDVVVVFAKQSNPLEIWDYFINTMYMNVCVDTVLALCLIVLRQLREEEGDSLRRVVGKTEFSPFCGE